MGIRVFHSPKRRTPEEQRKVNEVRTVLLNRAFEMSEDRRRRDTEAYYDVMELRGQLVY